MTGVSPPSFIRGVVHQMGHPPNQTYRLYDDTTITRRQRNLIAITNWLSQTVIMFSRSKHLTVLYRYSQLLYIDIFH